MSNAWFNLLPQISQSKLEVSIATLLVQRCILHWQADSKASEEQQGRLHALLWNQATRHFQMKDHDKAVAIFEADLHYAPKTGRAKVARTLALSSLALKNFDRSALPTQAKLRFVPGPDGAYESQGAAPASCSDRLQVTMFH